MLIVNSIIFILMLLMTAMFFGDIQSAINEGRLKFSDKMQVDTHPFPINMVELGDKKMLIRPSQTESTANENLIICEQLPNPLGDIKGIVKKVQVDNTPKGLCEKTIESAKVAAADGYETAAGSFIVSEITVLVEASSKGPVIIGANSGTDEACVSPDVLHEAKPGELDT